MYDRILVPLDGSAFSTEVIPHAAGIAAAHGTPLVLLRVVQKDAQRAEAERALRELGDRWGARTLCVAALGDVADAIIREAGRVAHTLIALTSRGHSGLMEAVLGSVALRVVRASAAPVLVHRPRGHVDAGVAQAVTTVVLALDGGEVSETMMEPAAGFARWVGADMEIVSVIDPAAIGSSSAGDPPAGKALESAYVRSRAEHLGKRFGIEAAWETLGGARPADAIAGYVAGRPGVVLAMATRGRGAVRSAVMGSVSSDCLRRAGVPILVRVP